MNEHIHGSMHKELSFVQLQMNTYAFGLFQDDVKNRKIWNLPKKTKLQTRKKNVDGKVVLGVNLDVRMPEIDDVKPLN